MYFYVDSAWRTTISRVATQICVQCLKMLCQMIIRVENNLRKMDKDCHGEGFYAQLVAGEKGGPSGRAGGRYG
ncbi:hypothetical protein CAEBREN_18561 [Caenorhabditis brenneri]|uniref:Uncharacterized protein n=1 Tax=Caenorhabditis brenneri TaxID=135651 RepID=G0NKF2_CAEBE|nr:hypothetical protein CAEBREN_18561 [Caenorhabditis brenneri]